jgi:hypothetical protein
LGYRVPEGELQRFLTDSNEGRYAPPESGVGDLESVSRLPPA